MKTISKRLKTIAGMVKFASLADVGTDHAFLPIYLCSEGDTVKNAVPKRIAACDVNRQPLESAAKNITEHGLEAVIETRLGSGLEPLAMGEFETLVMAGMGGALIIELLSARLEVAKSFKQLILQPQRSFYQLRKFLAANGFAIHNEVLLEENDVFYFVIDAAPRESEAYTEKELHFGKFAQENNPDVFEQYIAREIKQYEQIMAQHNAGDAARAYLELCKQTAFL